MFLKEIQKSKLRKIRIKQLLLLILRIIIIILLVFAFSNPVYKGYLSGSNPDIRKCGIFLLDNSFSMTVKDENGSYFEQAKKTVENILKLYNSNDKLFLITSSHLRNFEKGESKDISDLIDSLKTLELTSVPFNLSNLLKYVKDIEDKENFPLYEIFIISDFRKINFTDDNSDKNLFKNSSKNIHIYNIGIGKREANNISIEKAEIKSKILEYNRDVKVSVILKNFNKFNALNKQVNLFVDDKKVSESVSDIASLERKEIILTFKPLHTGSFSGYAELVQNDFFEDEISQDNKFYFTFNIPEKINIGLIGDNDISFKYIRLAVESAEKLDNITAGNQELYQINRATEVNNEILKSDMLIISGKNNFSENEINALSGYINEGGGVLIFPDRIINTSSYNALLKKLNAFRIDDLKKPESDTNKYRKFGKIDFEHPIFSGAFKDEKLSITSDNFYVESPKISTIYNIIPNNNCLSLMQLRDNKIFLSESKSGEGKIVFCAVSGDESMSDFPATSLFPLIINRCIYYLGIGEYNSNINIVGKNNLVFFGKNKVYSIPYNTEYKEPGIFSIKDYENKNVFFSLNRDSLESNLQKAETGELKEYFDSLDINQVKYITELSEINPVIVKSREGRELWKYLIVLALIFVIFEMIYSKKLEKI